VEREVERVEIISMRWKNEGMNLLRCFETSKPVQISQFRKVFLGNCIFPIEEGIGI